MQRGALSSDRRVPRVSWRRMSLCSRCSADSCWSANISTYQYLRCSLRLVSAMVFRTSTGGCCSGRLPLKQKRDEGNNSGFSTPGWSYLAGDHQSRRSDIEKEDIFLTLLLLESMHPLVAGVHIVDCDRCGCCHQCLCVPILVVSCLSLFAPSDGNVSGVVRIRMRSAPSYWGNHVCHKQKYYWRSKGVVVAGQTIVEATRRLVCVAPIRHNR